MTFLLLLACGNSPDSSLDDDPIGRVTGTVWDADASALEGVAVTLPGYGTVLTDDSGRYIFDAVDAGTELLLSFAKPGYTDNFQKASLVGWETVSVDATLAGVDGVRWFNAAEGGVVKVDYVSIDFQPNGIVDTDGNPYAGDVMVEVTFLDPRGPDMAYAPGDMSALKFEAADGAKEEPTSPALLVSYGMVEAKLYDEDGNRVQLDDGSPAGVSIPVMNEGLPNVDQTRDGDTQPSWSFDTDKGIWVEEGEGTVDWLEIEVEDENGEVIAVEERLMFTFEASHFSWWNCDKPPKQTCASGFFTDCLGFPVRGAKVKATDTSTGTTVTKYTNAAGGFQVEVLAGRTYTFEYSIEMPMGTMREWTVTKYIDCPDGEHFCEVDESGINGACFPVTDPGEAFPDECLCQESGIVMADNISVYASGIDNGQEVDQLRGWFWEPPGDPHRCDDPWELIPMDDCVLVEPSEFEKYFWNRPAGIGTNTRSVGNWLRLYTQREAYTMDAHEVDGMPVYMWETLELAEEGTEIVRDPVDLREGDWITATLPGNRDSYVGAMVAQDWIRIPNDIQNLSATEAMGDHARTQGIHLTYTAGDADYMIAFVSGSPDEGGLMCRAKDDGSFDISGEDLSEMTTGWGSVAIYRPNIGWVEQGPGNYPIRVQGLSGALVEVNLR